MNELTATPTHASVLYLRLGDIASKPVVEQARMRAQLEAVVATGLSVLPEGDRIVLDAPDGIALVVLDNALGALKAAERCLDAAAVLPLSIGAGHGAVACVSGSGSVRGLLGDGLRSAAVAAGFAPPARLLATKAFREAVSQQEPVRQADLVPAGTFADASVRTHELFAMDGLARRRRRGRLALGGAAAVAVLLVAGFVGRLAYRQEGPFAPDAVVALAVSPGGEVFLDGVPQGPRILEQRRASIDPGAQQPIARRGLRVGPAHLGGRRQPVASAVREHRLVEADDVEHLVVAARVVPVANRLAGRRQPAGGEHAGEAARPAAVHPEDDDGERLGPHHET
jgi:hypothetical protein